MGYYNNGRYDGGYNHRPRDRYNDRKESTMEFKYKVGDVCRLNANPDIQATIIRIGREQYECRMPDLRTIWFYEHELIDG